MTTLTASSQLTDGCDVAMAHCTASELVAGAVTCGLAG